MKLRIWNQHYEILKYGFHDCIRIRIITVEYKTCLTGNASREGEGRKMNQWLCMYIILTFTYTFTFTITYLYIYIYIYIYIYMDIHLSTYLYIHIHICVCSWDRGRIHCLQILHQQSAQPRWKHSLYSQIAKFMGPICGPPVSSRPQMGPMLAPWTMLSGLCYVSILLYVQILPNDRVLMISFKILYTMIFWAHFVIYPTQ